MQRTKEIESLTVSDYSEGPLDEILDKGTDMWVFGINIKGKEVYIKLSKGIPDGPVICHSFHVAEHKMKYPFKNRVMKSPFTGGEVTLKQENGNLFSERRNSRSLIIIMYVTIREKILQRRNSMN